MTKDTRYSLVSKKDSAITRMAQNIAKRKKLTQSDIKILLRAYKLVEIPLINCGQRV